MASNKRNSRDTAGSKSERLAAKLRGMTEGQLQRFSREIAKLSKRGERRLIQRQITDELKRRDARRRHQRRLFWMSHGFRDLPRRRGPHSTLLGSDPWDDRNARVVIIDMYRTMTFLLRLARKHDDDPDYLKNHLPGFLVSFEGVPREKAKRASGQALERLKTARSRGIPSSARRIVQSLLETVGFHRITDRPSPKDRECVRLTDQRLRRIIASGDPLRLPPRQAANAIKEAEQQGHRFITMSAEVAQLDSEPHPSILMLERRRAADGSRWTDICDLVLASVEPGRCGLKRTFFGPEDETPLGTARDVVQEWSQQSKNTESARELVRLFLQRRK
jgi:hypothetical protein